MRQWPWGTLAWSRWPTGAQPRKGAMFVFTASLPIIPRMIGLTLVSHR